MQSDPTNPIPTILGRSPNLLAGMEGRDGLGVVRQISLREIVEDELNKIMAQREEVIRAFVAKYGFEPERFVQVHTPNEWFVRRRSDEEMQQLSAISAEL